eukprot:scaffold28329_cov137-Skeletonema_menzelii.AAC.1
MVLALEKTFLNSQLKTGVLRSGDDINHAVIHKCVTFSIFHFTLFETVRNAEKSNERKIQQVD